MFSTYTYRRALSLASMGLFNQAKKLPILPSSILHSWMGHEVYYSFSTTNMINKLVSCHKLESYIKCDKTIKTLEKKGINQFFPIQANTYGHIYDGFDIIASDRTGSGKTIAFTLPIIQRFRKQGVFNAQHQQKSSLPQYIIMAPTRELALQTTKEINSLNHYRNEIRVATLIGGTDMRDQKLQLRKGVHIIVATPGRLMDFYNRGDLNFDNIKVVCIDEADLMLEKGFKDDIEFILERIETQVVEKPQHLFFSATMPSWVINLTERFMTKNKKYLNMIGSSQTKTSTTVNHLALISPPQKKVQNIQYLINEFGNGGLVLIFTARKVEADFLAEDLNLKNCVLHGDINQLSRNRRLADFRQGRKPILIATDVAARGIDIPNVQLIIQYNSPQNVDAYIHRSGRTGRAGREGVCVSLINPFISQEKEILINIQRQANVKFQVSEMVPSEQIQGEVKLRKMPNYLQVPVRRQNRQSSYANVKKTGEINPTCLKIELKSNLVQIDFQKIKLELERLTNNVPLKIRKAIMRNKKVTLFLQFKEPEDCDKAHKLKVLKIQGKGAQDEIISELGNLQRMIILDDSQTIDRPVYRNSERGIPRNNRVFSQ